MLHLYLMLLVFLRHQISNAAAMDTNEHGTAQICNSMEIKSIKDLKLLQNCHIIVGHVHIMNLYISTKALDERSMATPIREITGYLMIYRVHGLDTLERFFPQLILIRGEELLFDQYSLVVYENRDMQNLGLSSLLRIQKGDVRIESNPSLCFVHTVNWVHLLGNSTRQHYWLQNNKPPQHCPKCKEANNISFTEAATLDLHCWNLDKNQRTQVLDGEHDKCGPDCLSNCGQDGCELCANLNQNGKCVNFCGIPFFQLYNRVCVGPSECYRQKLIPHAGVCMEKCPPAYKELNDARGVTICTLSCVGNFEIRRREDLIELEDCIIIYGSLTLKLADPKERIIDDLTRALSNVKEITGYLKIVRCPHLITLNFLQNLDTIRGDELIENKYAFYVVDNHHLEQIWVPNQKVAILKGLLYFHLNPRLCYDKIMELSTSVRATSMISIENVSPNSNGERVICGNSVRTLNATVEDFNSTAVRIKVNPMSFDEKMVLIGYLHYYKEAPVRNVTMYDGRHGCGHDNWRMDVSANRNIRHIITQLKPATQYAYFVKTMTMTDYHLQLDAYSEIQYFRTLPSKPGPVAKIFYHSMSATALKVHWWPPRKPNGQIRNYILFYEKVNAPQMNESDANYYLKSENIIDCECSASFLDSSGPVPQVENYYDKETITYDDAIPDILYHSRNKYNEPTKSTELESKETINKTENMENKTKPEPEPERIKKPAVSKEEAERQYMLYRQELENKSMAEQDTGINRFEIIKPKPTCVQPQLKEDCSNFEYFRGLELPGYQHSYVLSNLEPEVTYRISLRACVAQLVNGCGPESSILAGTVSKRMESFLKGLKSL